MTIEIKFPNGEIYTVPTEVIAKQRTLYYAGVDGFTEGSAEWDSEFKLSMDPEEIYDWIQNNTDWVDVKEFAAKKETPDANLDKLWFKAEFSIK